MAAMASMVNTVYGRAMTDVLTNVRQRFRDQGSDDATLNALQQVGEIFVKK